MDKVCFLSLKRTCSVCGKSKILLQCFSPNGVRAGKISYRSSCKTCESERSKQLRLKDPDYNKKQRARRNSYLCHRSKEVFSGRCMRCGVEYIFTASPCKPAKINFICKDCR